MEDSWKASPVGQPKHEEESGHKKDHGGKKGGMAEVTG